MHVENTHCKGVITACTVCVNINWIGFDQIINYVVICMY